MVSVQTVEAWHFQGQWESSLWLQCMKHGYIILGVQACGLCMMYECKMHDICSKLRAWEYLLYIYWFVFQEWNFLNLNLFNVQEFNNIYW